MLLHHHRVQYHHNFPSHRLKRPRDVVVWLPFNYGERRKRYPVLYMHDGQNILDPSTAFGGVPWRIDVTLDRLVRQRKIPEMIVVGSVEHDVCQCCGPRARGR